MRSGDNLGEMKSLFKKGKFPGGVVILWVIEVMLIIIKVNAGTSMPESNAQEAPTTEQYVEAVPNEPWPEEMTTEEIEEILPEPTEPQTEILTEPPHENTSPEPEWYIYLSYNEMYALATLVYLEGRGESIECQQAIASVVINRYTTSPDKYKNIFDVIYEPEQFSPAGLICETQPTQTQLDAVYAVARYGPNIPEYVTYFRANYFHEWGDQVPYVCMGSTYFSYSNSLKYKLENMEVIK